MPGKKTKIETPKRRWTAATIDLLGVPVKAVCDPIARVCYPALERHWQERYRKYWPDRFARRMLILDFTLLTIVASLIVVAAATYLIVPIAPGFANVRVEILAPQTLVSGRSTTYSVSYVNDSRQLLGCASLRLHLPPGTTITEEILPRIEDEAFCSAVGSTHGTVVENPSGTVLIYDLGNLEPDARGLATFDATVYAPTGSTRILAAELIYWQEGGTVPARASSLREWAVDDALLRLSVTPPQTLVRGRVTTVAYAYENASGSTLPPVTLRLTHPDDFILTGASLPGLRGEWSLGALEPGAQGSFTIYGYFADSPGATSAPVLTLEALVSDGAQERVLEAVRQNLDPRASGFSLTQDLGGLETRGVAPGQRINVQVRYANDGSEPLRDVTISLETDGRLIEQAEPANLTWDIFSNPELAELAPGASGTLEASFVIRRDPTAEPGAPSPTLSVSTFASFSHLDRADEVNKASTATVELPLASRLGLEAAALYYTKDGDQLGIGPLPPRVGQTTKYRVVLQISNTSGLVKDAVLEATLPPDVQWTDNYSVSNGEAIDWLPSSRKIHWVVGDLPAYAGTVGEYLGASFEVALTPSPASAGHVVPLLTDINLRGQDDTTGLTLHLTAEPVTTDLPFDARAAGKGVVEPN